jgi:hypothetical protein
MRRLKFRRRGSHYRRTLRMPTNGVQSAVASRHHGISRVRYEQKRNTDKFGPGDGRPPPTVANDRARVLGPSGKTGGTIQRQQPHR